MRNVTSRVIVLVAVTACVVLATAVVGQENDKGDWVQKAENTGARMKEFADAMKERMKTLSGRQLDDEENKLDQAIEEVNDEIDALGKDIDTLNRGINRLYKAQRLLFKAQTELFNAQRALFDAKSSRERQEARAIHETANAETPETRKELEGAKKELVALAKGLAFEPGDEVVALRDAALKAGRETVGTVRKGEKLVVEQTQDSWLWVRSDETRGWIDSRSVVNAALVAWYQRLPDNESVEKSGVTRGKFGGVMFEIHNAGSQPLPNSFLGGGTVNGRPFPSGVYVNSRNLGVFVEKAGDRHGALLIRFPGGKTIFPDMSALKPYGTVTQGDYVFISTHTRQVFVNGQLRRPR